MKTKLAFAAPILALFAGSAVLTFSGCGNGWLDSNDRRETSVALMFDAQQFYDKATSKTDYAKSSSAYKKAVALDPTNMNARMGLAFSLNAEAGVSLFDIMAKLIKEKGTTSTATSLTESSGVAQIRRIVGLDDTDKTELKLECENDLSKCAIKSMNDLRIASTKMYKLHQAWLAICPIMATEILDTLAMDVKTYTLFEIDKCKGGIGDALVSPGAIFAAAISNLAFSMSLFEIIDQKGLGGSTTPDGIPDIVEETQTFFTGSQANINTAKDNVAACTDPATTITECLPTNPSPMAKFTYMNTQIAAANAGISDLNSAISGARAKIYSDANNMTMASLQLLSDLASQLARKAGLPSSVTSTLNQATDSLKTAKAEADKILPSTEITADTTTGTTAIPGASSTTPAATKAQATEAAKNADTMLGKQMAEMQTARAAATNESDRLAIDNQIKTATENNNAICANFSVLAVQAGLGAGAEPPCSCRDNSVLKNTCCAKKADVAAQTECCSGAYNATETNYGTEIVACKAVALTPAFVGMLLEGTSNKATSAGSDTADGLLEFFSLANSAWHKQNK